MPPVKITEVFEGMREKILHRRGICKFFFDKPEFICTLETIMIAIATESNSGTGGGAHRANSLNVSIVGSVAELGGGDSTVENVTTGGIGRQRIKKAAADGEHIHEKRLECEL